MSSYELRRILERAGIRATEDEVTVLVRERLHDHVVELSWGGFTYRQQRRRSAEQEGAGAQDDRPTNVLGAVSRLTDVAADALWLTVHDCSGKRLFSLAVDKVSPTRSSPRPPSYWVTVPAVSSSLFDLLAADDPEVRIPPWSRRAGPARAGHWPGPTTVVLWSEPEVTSLRIRLAHLIERTLNVPWSRVSIDVQRCSEPEEMRRLRVLEQIPIARRRHEAWTPRRLAQASCIRCGQPLSDPESIRLGVGPECQKYYAAHEFRAAMQHKRTPVHMLFASVSVEEWVTRTIWRMVLMGDLRGPGQ